MAGVFGVLCYKVHYDRNGNAIAVEDAKGKVFINKDNVTEFPPLEGQTVKVEIVENETILISTGSRCCWRKILGRYVCVPC